MKFCTLSKAIAIGIALCVSQANVLAADMGAKDEPIKLAINEWTGQHISTHIAGNILENMGYQVEYVTAGYYPQMQALEDNTVSATLEIWSSNIGEHYDNALASGNVVELGDLGLVPIETWMYNNAAAEKCPGLPDWNVLNDCAEAFGNAETFPNGRLVDYPADWGTTNVDRIGGLGLNYTSVPAGSEGALIAEMQGAEARNEPLLVMFWSPHWVHAVVDLKPMTLPPYEEGCHDDPAVGVNPNATWDCDWARGYIKKMAWKGMADKWPAAHALLEAYTLRNEDQIPMMNAIDQEGKKLDEVTAQWIADNESIWKPWVDAATQ
ncbi:MAG: ABC transporter substrate-binding protein [Gammaproteobacteria bacterium]|nr:ABC transporter substrate-binding protein [Gammaproteobacteria bacterium]